MLKVSTAATTLLIALFILGATAYAESPAWPLRGRIDLSSGFGDYRVNRFHAGIDLRTGGKIGKPVYAPVSGYVWRVKMSYVGYGKGLYIKGNDGHLYVFGHLSALSDKIDRSVKEAQNKAQRYYVDLYLPRDSIPVKKGEKIALSGQTGVGAPHLHFEDRSPNNQPLNPLTHGFKVKDKVRPTFLRVGFELTDDRSLFPDGSRTFFVDAQSSKTGRYQVDTVLYLSSPFGLVVDCYDQMRSGGMRQAVYKLALSVDGRLIYESVFDTLDFEIGPSAMLEYDHVAAAGGEKRVRRLYDRPGNRYSGSGGVANGLGLIGADSSMAEGVHEGLIEAEDAFGNKSRLEFKFMWGPEVPYIVDTIVENSDVDVFVKPTTGSPTGSYDSVSFELGVDGSWVAVPGDKVRRLNDGWKKFEGLSVSSLLRLRAAYPGGECLRPLRLLTSGEGIGIDSVSYSLEGNGLVVSAKTSGIFVNPILVGGWPCDTVSLSNSTKTSDGYHHHIFFLPTVDASDVDTLYVWPLQMDYGFPNDDWRQPVNISAVGYTDHTLYSGDSLFSVQTTRGTFYEPRFLDLEDGRVPKEGPDPGLVSKCYRLLPEAFVTAKPFHVELKADPAEIGVRPKQAGLCWYDEKHYKWVWINEYYEDDTTSGLTPSAEAPHPRGYYPSGLSMGGGLFGVLIDTTAPTIANLSVKEGLTYKGLKPVIQFTLKDTLSGIKDDRFIDARINGQWLIPEYEPELDRCKVYPYEPLKPGKCKLMIVVEDQAGNVAEHRVDFFVKD